MSRRVPVDNRTMDWPRMVANGINELQLVAEGLNDNYQPLDDTLTALAALDGTAGLLVQTGADTFAKRSVAAPAAGITVTNPAGTAGNITLGLADDLAALEALSGTNTIYYRNGVSSWGAVTIGGTLTFSGGTLSVTGAAVTKTDDTNVTLTLGGSPSTGAVNAFSLTLGWTGTLDVTRGGTGRATSTTAYGLIAAGTTATGAHQTLAAGATTEILVGGGASALPVWTTATGTGAPARAGSPTFTGTVNAAAVTMSGQLTITANNIQMDNNTYIYGRIAAANSTRMLGINGTDAFYCGALDRPVTSLNFVSNGVGWMVLSGTILNIPTGSTYRINNVQLITARKTGWATATGTATRTTFDTTTVTLPQLAERVKALIDDLHGTAGHGLIGT